MKLLIAACCSLCLGLSFFLPPAESYQVIYTKGKVTRQLNGELLMPRVAVSPKEKLKFSSKSSYLVVQNKRRVLSKIQPNSNLFSYSTRLLRPSGSTRDICIANTYADLVNFFADTLHLKKNDPLVLENYVPELPTDAQHYFFIRYRFKQETINKKLSFFEHYTILDPDEIYRIDGAAINSDSVAEMSFHYRNDKKSESVFISKVTVRLNEL